MRNKLFFAVIFACITFLSPVAVLAQNKGKGKKDIAIQLYSVRERIKSDANEPGKSNSGYIAVLKLLGATGYTAVEAAGYNNGMFYNRTPEEFKKDVESAGMKVLSSHCTKGLSAEELASGDFTESLKWWDTAIKAHKAAGMKYIVTPWLEIPKTVKDLKTYCDYYNQVGKMCKEYGLQYGYHNHAHEYEKVEDQVKMLDYMIENTNPEYVFIEMDVYWTVIGKSSPVDYFKKYPGRFKMLHIKDHREIGQSGMVGFDAIFKNADTAGVKDIVVEFEGYTTSIEDCLKISNDYLQQAPFVKTSYAK
ncbi:sugar phosphate isomerase/epimerase [Prevotella sp. 10(H)]|uniref:sugar phosphate isomerase/epimerase family protein n=1 Tax=Prevotella sp. 10(H) TaxID=1158294 RepID=UPI0004A6C63A|nr:sugar phosphate isomerase/epimerase [Prevotella sp. 10(H)]